jgi:hypothetical protein
MNRQIQGAKTRLFASHADKIRAAFQNAFDADAIAQSFAETHPAGGSIEPQMARDWVRIHAHLDKKELGEALKKAYADGWVFGSDLAQYNLANRKTTKAPKVGVVDWNTWKAGNRGASQLLKPKGGLQTLLDSRGIVIEGITNTKLDRIGTVLSAALAQGVTPKEVSVMVDQVVNDPQQALVIAQTEMSRAVVQSELQDYRTSGVEMLEWLVADPCDDCADNEDASPISIDDSWPNGDAPVHPNCMCDIAPYSVSGDIELGVMPEIVKMVPSELEEERALSRLKILPNPTDYPDDLDPEKLVESPWAITEQFTIDPNIWDEAELALVGFHELTATDKFLRRKKVKQHIKAMGQAITQYRSFALVIERDNELIIIDGHHRLAAMWLLGMTDAPVWLAKEK